MPYALPWYQDQVEFPDDPDMWLGFTAQDYTLAYALDVEHNVDAQDLVEAAVRASDPALAERITWDSEMGCFFAYTHERSDMEQLVAAVAELVEQRNKDATPGTIADSPAFIRYWDRLLSDPQ
jgi:hypothetical protein